MKLYELSMQYFDLMTDDELTAEELDEKLSQLDGELEDKVSNGIGLIRQLSLTSDAVGAEIKRLTERKKSLDNRIDRIKNYYLSTLTEMDKKKVVTARGSMTIAKCGGKKPLIIDDKTSIPEGFWVEVPAQMEIDKETLREALENGEVVNGAHLQERGNYLKIS